MKSTQEKPKINLGCFRMIIVAVALTGTFLSQHYRRQTQDQEANIRGLETLTNHTDSLLRQKKLKDSIREHRTPKGRPLPHMKESEDDSLRALYDVNDPNYVPTELHETDEWSNYFN
jgi:hypothetical protein